MMTDQAHSAAKPEHVRKVLDNLKARVKLVTAEGNTFEEVSEPDLWDDIASAVCKAFLNAYEPLP